MDAKRTPDGRFTPEGARAMAAGRRGSGRPRTRLTLAQLTVELGELETPRDAKRWLAAAYRWAAVKLLPGTAANACVRAVAEWQKIHESEATFEAIEELRSTVARVTAERDELRRKVEQLELTRRRGAA